MYLYGCGCGYLNRSVYRKDYHFFKLSYIFLFIFRSSCRKYSYSISLHLGSFLYFNKQRFVSFMATYCCFDANINSIMVYFCIFLVIINQSINQSINQVLSSNYSTIVNCSSYTLIVNANFV